MFAIKGGRAGMKVRSYIAIDLKSFYASVECTAYLGVPD